MTAELNVERSMRACEAKVEGRGTALQGLARHLILDLNFEITVGQQHILTNTCCNGKLPQAPAMLKKKFSHEDYIIGWICPLEVEQIAALEMLDDEHERLPQQPADHNVYSLGSINGHNVVIAGLPHTGNNPAATVVTQMRMTFPNLRIGVLVGIGGGVPAKTDNGMIRLGDVVVSKPAGTHSGAVQYDRGKAETGHFRRTGALGLPPVVLLNAAQDLAAKRARTRKDPVMENIKRINTDIPGLRRYRYPGPECDHLYASDYTHLDPSLPCNECGCDPARRVQRELDEDESDDPRVIVHRGLVASGELVIKNGELRDSLAHELGVLCFEMEAAGALADFPCMVVRGISDYCDSHKNDRWHGYAAAAAAAYARQLFFHMPVDGVKRSVSAFSSGAPDPADSNQLRVPGRGRWRRSAKSATRRSRPSGHPRLAHADRLRCSAERFHRQATRRNRAVVPRFGRIS